MKMVSEIPKAIMSFKINASGNKKPSIFSMAFGVVNIKLIVTIKVADAIKPPTSPP
jgi:hypothetical protein